MRWNRRKVAASVAVLVAAGVAAGWQATREEPFDTRFNGAYRLEDGSPGGGRLVVITPREGKVLRARFLNGDSRALWPVASNRYESGPGWAERKPVELAVTFVTAAGRVTGVRWTGNDGQAQEGRRLELPEVPATFRSGDVTLRAKLVLPEGPGPFPAAVLVHGSESDSAVDRYFEPYLYAAHGIATLVYDKRGTGGSGGKYTQNFHLLARDVVAAAGWLRSRPEIDPGRIHLVGFSQGGWIAPLAASQVAGIRSLLINFGPLVPVAEEDRWGYVYALRHQGFGDDAVRRADRLNDLIRGIVDRGENRWAELGRGLDAARGAPWFRAVRGSDSILGQVAASRAPLWAQRLYAWWKLRPRNGVAFSERLYDPVPTLAGLAVPSLWILAGEDKSMPTAWTVDRLEALRREGRPIEVALYPQADHSILRFVEDKNGERQVVGYEPTYFPRAIGWLRRQSGLPEL